MQACHTRTLVHSWQHQKVAAVTASSSIAAQQQPLSFDFKPMELVAASPASSMELVSLCAKRGRYAEPTMVDEPMVCTGTCHSSTSGSKQQQRDAARNSSSIAEQQR